MEPSYQQNRRTIAPSATNRLPDWLPLGQRTSISGVVWMTLRLQVSLKERLAFRRRWPKLDINNSSAFAVLSTKRPGNRREESAHFKFGFKMKLSIFDFE